jgi:hypothetical protein
LGHVWRSERIKKKPLLYRSIDLKCGSGIGSVYTFPGVNWCVLKCLELGAAMAPNITIVL